MTTAASRPRVVIDTDTANEIDDQFALAWALRASDRIQLEGVHAAPFSHGRYFEALRHASAERGGPHSDFDHIATGMAPKALKALIERTPPGLGTEKSLEEIRRVFEAANVPREDLIRAGAMSFMPDAQTPVASEAVDHLIELAHSASSEEPIHVATIGAPTNVASALLTDPRIAPKLRVLFLAGYPSGAGIDDDSFNLVQDRHASNVLLESDVPLIYIPGYQVAELLQLSLPAAKEWLSGRGPLAEFLLDTFRNNPINPQVESVGRSWVLWDIIAIAWLLDPSWVPTRPVPRARVGSDHRWQPIDRAGATMLEAYHAKRNLIFEDFFARVMDGEG